MFWPKTTAVCAFGGPITRRFSLAKSNSKSILQYGRLRYKSAQRTASLEPRCCGPMHLLALSIVLHVHVQEDVFIGELKFDDKEGNVLGCLRFAFSQLGMDSKQDL